MANVLPPRVDETAVPAPLDRLMPWHRPRKQIVRERQWIRYARELIDSERGKPGLPAPIGALPQVHYLTLPGTDYLDVRLLGELCRQKDCRLKSTGLLAGPPMNPHMARAKLREQALVDAGYVTDESQIYPYRFEEITAVTGMTYRLLEERGPFHIVNVDACGSIAAPTAQHSHRLVDALYRVVEFQLTHRADRWLLFVTVDARPDSIDEETLGNLYDAVVKNAQQSASFEAAVLSMVGNTGGPVDNAMRAVTVRDGAPFLRVFALSLSKWLLHFADEADWDTKTHTAYCYSTTQHDDQTPTMACLALEFLPRRAGLPDPFAVTRADPAPPNAAIDTSLRAISKIAAMEDLDQALRASPPLHDRMARRTAELLKEAGYPDSVLADLVAPVPA